jgi:ABC-type branched-subunit amino acid transport system permease subunit
MLIAGLLLAFVAGGLIALMLGLQYVRLKSDFAACLAKVENMISELKALKGKL